MEAQKDDLSELILQMKVLEKRLLKNERIAGLELHIFIPPGGEHKNGAEQLFYSRFGEDSNSEVSCRVIYNE